MDMKSMWLLAQKRYNQKNELTQMSEDIFKAYISRVHAYKLEHKII